MPTYVCNVCQGPRRGHKKPHPPHRAGGRRSCKVANVGFMELNSCLLKDP